MYACVLQTLCMPQCLKFTFLACMLVLMPKPCLQSSSDFTLLTHPVGGQSNLSVIGFSHWILAMLVMTEVVQCKKIQKTRHR